MRFSHKTSNEFPSDYAPDLIHTVKRFLDRFYLYLFSSLDKSSHQSPSFRHFIKALKLGISVIKTLKSSKHVAALNKRIILF